MPTEAVAATIPLDWTNIIIAAIAILVLVAGFGALIFFRPNSFTRIRINLLWLATLIAVLTLVFGMRLIDLLANPNGTDGNNNTVEIVLSSLVGVGIGGLIAIAGQLVQDVADRTTDQRENSDQ